MTPKRLPRGSGGGFGLHFGVPGGALERHFSQKVVIFSDPVLGGLLGPFFNDFSSIFGRFFGACFEGFVTRLANSETSILAAIYYT